MEKISVALLGLGTMGSGMAANLLKASFPLAVYNRTAAKAESFAAQGARIARTPAEAARGARLILSMLSDDNASRDAWIGPEGALAAAESGTVLVESSTASPAWITELAELARARDLEFLDAPVTGSRAQAEGGQLERGARAGAWLHEEIYERLAAQRGDFLDLPGADLLEGGGCIEDEREFLW